MTLFLQTFKNTNTMKARYFFLAAALFAAGQLLAQETYQNAKVTIEDLNGTARYVGTGGALDALGAEISTAGTNPAGIGLFRRGKVEATVGVVSQQDAAEYNHGNATNVSFDQAGFVWSNRTGETSFVNLAFNYHKSRNFDYILSADAAFGATTPEGNTVYASQNKLSYMKLINGYMYQLDPEGFPMWNRELSSCNQLDDLYEKNVLYASGEEFPYFYEAQSYDFDRAHKGYIGEYDLNISGNINDRVYLGLTVGLHDVHYKHIGDYTEKIFPNEENINKLNVYDERKITGVGADVKAGILFRPISYMPLIIGASISSPIYYDLKTSNYTELSDGRNTSWASDEYKYKIYTPWKFGLNAGYTDGRYFALGATYEYSDYGSILTRVDDDGSYYIYDYYESSHNDKDMNYHTENTLKGVSTIKLGAEVKPIPELALRCGYNYVSPAYNKLGFKDGSIQSNGSYVSSATDFTNWKATNRFTLGLGYRLGKTNIDVAYQYSNTKGDFYPFMSYEDVEFYSFDNIAKAVEVSNKRHQVVCTIGYAF